MSATYRFVGDAPEVFLRFSGAMTVAGVVRDPEAEGYQPPWRDGEANPDHQPPGELRPGQEFELPEDLYVRHARIERKEGRKWVPTVTADDQPTESVTEPATGDQGQEA